MGGLTESSEAGGLLLVGPLEGAYREWGGIEQRRWFTFRGFVFM